MRLILMSCVLLALTAVAMADAQSRPEPGILDKAAPSWDVTEWINLPAEAKSLDVTDFKGKVVYLYAFQSWCPGCHSRGFPTLKSLIDQYRGNDDVVFIAVQTTFEGFQSNTARDAWRTARRYRLDIPIGHTGSEARRPALMQRYRTGGTPWTIIIDRAGVVRFNAFHIEPEQARRRIDRLLVQDLPTPDITTLPASRGGQDIVGTLLPPLRFDRVLDANRTSNESSSQRVTLYRWWTDGCPFCRDSLPAIETIRKDYADRGLDIVAVYHPKPARRVRPARALREARRLGYHGTVAIDEDWSELSRLYLDRGERGATSASFLVDAHGVVRFVHPGPVLFPSDDPAQTRENEDYRLLRKAIETLLPLKSPAPATPERQSSPNSSSSGPRSGS